MNKYLGHPLQITGVEEMTLTKGKGKGMTLLNIRNGKGLDVMLSADRAMDISRLTFEGVNMGYFGPCGYVGPSFYDNKGEGFLKSFSAGFLTTCGLTAVGNPNTDDGEELPLHGTIGNTPCEDYTYAETDTEITVNATLREASMFGKKLLFTRNYTISKTENSITIEDEIYNYGDKQVPCMILYHFNMGYPLLSEHAKLTIPYNSITPRCENSRKHMDTALQMEQPQANYKECNYVYDLKAVDNMASIGIYNPDIQKGLKMTVDKRTLDLFNEWKMMGEHDYVLGLEPANCACDGRNIMREKGILKFLDAGATYKTFVKVEFGCKDFFAE